MKLQGKLSRPGTKSLMRRDSRRGQQIAAARQVKGITVPVQYWRTGKLRQGAADARRGQLNPSPADFLGCTGVHLGIQSAGHELRPEVNAQQGPPRG